MSCSRCNCDLRQPVAVIFITGDVGSRRPPSSCWASVLAATASAPVLFVLTPFGSSAAAPAVSPASAVVGDAVSDSNPAATTLPPVKLILAPRLQPYVSACHCFALPNRCCLRRRRCCRLRVRCLKLRCACHLFCCSSPR